MNMPPEWLIAMLSIARSCLDNLKTPIFLLIIMGFSSCTPIEPEPPVVQLNGSSEIRICVFCLVGD